jgi:RNA polymerase sigma-70 factor, ECF subfamily
LLRNARAGAVNSKSLTLVQTVADRCSAFDLRRSSQLEAKVTELFNLLHRPVLRYVLAILGDRGTAEDVTQDVFLRLYVSLRRGEDIVHIRAWVFQVAYRLTMDVMRATHKVEFVPDDVALLAFGSMPDTSANPEENLSESEQRDQLLAAFQRLSPQERNCLNLRAEGLSYGEIASVLGIRSSSVGNFLARGICKIRKIIP